MDVSVKNFEKLFSPRINCVVPVFQRPYVWDEDGQWEPLWEDIEQIAADYLLRLQETNGNRTEAQVSARRHFMGTIVLQQQPKLIGQPDQALVIDGQQRLTTIQLLLDAASDVYAEKGFDREAESLRRLVENQQASGQERFKLQPSADNRDSFVAAMTRDRTFDGPRDDPMVDCHGYFAHHIDEWIESGELGYTRDERADALFISLYGLFDTAIIELSERDDPYVIFETLNARGTPLTPSDLVKNYILQAAAQSVEMAQHDELLQQLWQPLETEFWREEIRTGALIRSQLDVFLHYWLVSTVVEDVRFDGVFGKFKNYADQQRKQGVTAQNIAAQIHDAADIYKSWTEYPPHSRRGVFFRRGRVCGLGGMSPLLLYIDTQHDSVLDEQQKLLIFADLESYLVRRALCRAITAGLNRISVDAMHRLREVEPLRWPEMLRGHFANLKGSLRWPQDEELTDSLVARPVYGRVGKRRLRMVLSAIEEHKRDNSTFVPDSAFESSGLSIEHIMPRRWQQHWPTADDSQESIARREQAVDVLGNLTLVNSGLNSSISNGPWSEKRTAIADNSTLLLNKDFTDSHAWDEAAIAQRGEKLLHTIKDIWPRPRD
ncbi:MAG: DUF262 domain-containing protein [Acidimicrobiaceae bacterium]|nr:DUF262 domain-containing protein [Acidimicrobiaceae bacterium]